MKEPNTKKDPLTRRLLIGFRWVTDNPENMKAVHEDTFSLPTPF